MPTIDPVVRAHSQLLVRRLVLARLASGLSQQQLATTLGVTRQAVAQWEHPRSDIRLMTAATWAAALGVKLALDPAPGWYLIEDGDNPTFTPSRHLAVHGPQRREAAEAAGRLHPVGDKVIIASDDVAAVTDLRTRMEAVLFGGRPDPGTVTVCLEDAGPSMHTAVTDMCAYAHQAMWAVVVVAPTSETVTVAGTRNLAGHLHAEDGIVTYHPADPSEDVGQGPPARFTLVERR